jgi:glycosyltransferase involved in cell wall biosynthesis/SAM-dependent methyltransferase
MFAAQLVTGKRVLDVGTGSGYGTVCFSIADAHSVDGLDKSVDAVEHARQHYGRSGISFHVADATNFSLNKIFDAATCFDLIEHVDDQDGVVASVKKHLTADGILVISTRRPAPGKPNEFHLRELSAANARDLVLRHFRHVRLFREENFCGSCVYAEGEKLDASLKNASMKDLRLTDQAADPDFIILVASDDDAALHRHFEPAATLNDEGYLHKVEEDNRSLFRAEHDLRGDIAAMERVEQNLRDSLAEMEEDSRGRTRNLALTRENLEQCKKKSEVLQERQVELDRQLADYHQILADRDAFRDLSQSLERELSAARAEFDAFRIRWRWPLRAARAVAGLSSRQQTKANAQAAARLVQRHSARIISRLATPVTNATIGSNFRIGLASLGYKHPSWILTGRSSGPSRLKRVAFFVGCPEGESKRYRVYNIVDGLKMLSIDSAVLYEDDAASFQTKPRPDLVVIFRARYNSNVKRLIDIADSHGIPVVFDIDDLVFEPDSLNYIGAVKNLAENEKKFHAQEVARFKETLDRCHYATATTNFLVQRLSRLNKISYVIPNTINLSQLRASVRLNVETQRSTEIFRIGYFSGSATHNVDFLEAADGILAVLGNFGNVDLYIVGDLDLDERFDDFRSRIFRQPFMPYLDMLARLASMHVTVAPLERENPFASGKSELKIFEAALVKVPCVASPVDPYRGCIVDGVNGFLALNPSDWERVLSQLVKDPSLAVKIGECAYRDFVPKFEYRRVALQIASTYQSILDHAAERRR